MHDRRVLVPGVVFMAGGVVHVSERPQQECREHTDTPLYGYEALHSIGAVGKRVCMTP